MSREIKFRAWDKTYNFMSHKVLVGNTDSKDENYTAHSMWIEPVNVDYDREPGWMHFDEHSDVVLMQYTGLKDKNGKEIYEGDILTAGSYPFQDDGEYNYHLVVEYIEYGFCGVMHCVGKGRRGISHGIAENLELADKYEVIGNIYEHSHLLEVQHD